MKGQRWLRLPASFLAPSPCSKARTGLGLSQRFLTFLPMSAGVTIFRASRACIATLFASTTGVAQGFPAYTIDLINETGAGFVAFILSPTGPADNHCRWVQGLPSWDTQDPRGCDLGMGAGASIVCGTSVRQSTCRIHVDHAVRLWAGVAYSDNSLNWKWYWTTAVHIVGLAGGYYHYLTCGQKGKSPASTADGSRWHPRSRPTRVRQAEKR